MTERNQYLEDAKDEVDEFGRKAKTFLVPYWQKAYKWFSVQSAALLTLLLSVQGYLHDSAGDLALVTQSGWWNVMTAGLAALTIALRLVHQPSPPEAIATPTAVVPVDGKL